MFRSRSERQSDSARKYLDFAAVSPALENAAEVTAHALKFPIALVNILDHHNQYTLVGYGAEPLEGAVMPRTTSACTSVVDLGRPIVVEDVDAVATGTGDTEPVSAGAALAAPNEALIRALRDGGMRAYASVPLFGRESIPIGTLCVLDPNPHRLTGDGLRLLEQLAVMVEEHLDAQRDRARVTVRPASVEEITAAVDSGEISPWYEPIVDLQTGVIYAVEALARWEHPAHGIITPGDFVEQMENTDLIVDLDLLVLTRALADFGTWLLDRPDLKLSVNISGHHLERLDCVDRIVSAARAASVPAESIVLEITETARGHAVDGEARVVRALRAAGFSVFLDDLGSGWSPVPRLTHVAVDGFKLDRSVAASLHTKVGEAVALAMLQFAHDLGHRVILEGLETSDRLERAVRMGFTHGQGHHFSVAVPAADVPTLLSDLDDNREWASPPPAT